MKVSVDKCSGPECICKSLPPKGMTTQEAGDAIKILGAVFKTGTGIVINQHGFSGFPPPAAGGAAMRMAQAREMDLLRMQRIQP